MQLGGEAVEVREQAALVDAHEVELVSQAADVRGGDHELGQRVGETVPFARWLRFCLPLCAILFALALAAIAVAVGLNLQ